MIQPDAAPYLLEALVRLTDTIEQAWPGLKPLAPLVQARAAIARAKGEASPPSARAPQIASLKSRDRP